MGGWCGLERPVLSQCSRTGGSMGTQRRDPARFPSLRKRAVCSRLLAVGVRWARMCPAEPANGATQDLAHPTSPVAITSHTSIFDAKMSIWQRLTVAADASA